MAKPNSPNPLDRMTWEERFSVAWLALVRMESKHQEALDEIKDLRLALAMERSQPKLDRLELHREGVNEANRRSRLRKKLHLAA